MRQSNREHDDGTPKTDPDPVGPSARLKHARDSGDEILRAAQRALSGDSEVSHFAGKDRQDPWRKRHTLYVEAHKPE